MIEYIFWSEINNPDAEAEVCCISDWSGKQNTMKMKLTLDQYNKWRDGELIQNAMPHLTLDEREFLMTGATSQEWDDLWKENEDET